MLWVLFTAIMLYIVWNAAGGVQHIF